MSKFPDYISPVEQAIIGRLIDAALAKGYKLAVYDEVELVQERTTDRDQIVAAVGHTEVTSFKVLAGDGAYIGSILTIHGNEGDVISDASWPGNAPENEALIEALCDEANGEAPC